MGTLNTAMGGNEGESLSQTAKENAMESMLKEKIEAVGGAGVAASAPVDAFVEKVADAIGDKIPASMLGAHAVNSGGADGGLLASAQGMFAAQMQGASSTSASLPAADSSLFSMAQQMLSGNAPVEGEGVPPTQGNSFSAVAGQMMSATGGTQAPASDEGNPTGVLLGQAQNFLGGRQE